MLGELKNNALLERLFKGEQGTAFRQRIGDLASTCTVRTDEAMEEEKP